MKLTSSICLILICIASFVQFLNAVVPFCGSKHYGSCLEDCRMYLDKLENPDGEGCCCNAIRNNTNQHDGTVRVE